MSLETHVGAQKNENTAALAEYIVSLGFKVKTRPCFIWAYKTTYPGDTGNPEFLGIGGNRGHCFILLSLIDL